MFIVNVNSLWWRTQENFLYFLLKIMFICSFAILYMSVVHFDPLHPYCPLFLPHAPFLVPTHPLPINFSYYLFLFSYLRQGTTLLPKLVSNSWTPWILLPPDSWECKSVPLYSSPRSIFLVMKYKTFKVRQSKSLPFLVRLFLKKKNSGSLTVSQILKTAKLVAIW